MDEAEDWFSSTIDEAKRFPEITSLEEMRDGFARLERQLVTHLKVITETREKFISALALHTSPPQSLSDFTKFLVASADVLKFMYSVIRDEAYERKNKQMLIWLNQVHKERVLALKEHLLRLSSGKTPAALWSQMSHIIDDSEATYKASLETMQGFLSPPKKLGRPPSQKALVKK